MAIQLDSRLAVFQASKAAKRAAAIERAKAAKVQALRECQVTRIVEASGGRLTPTQAESVLARAIRLA